MNDADHLNGFGLMFIGTIVCAAAGLIIRSWSIISSDILICITLLCAAICVNMVSDAVRRK